MRALELYSGIGGFAAGAAGLDIEVVAALDISPHVVPAYNANWEPVAKQADLLSLSLQDLARFEADLWWMSPPCAPYTRRGNKLDLDDHRAASFLHVVRAVRELRPARLAMENVEGFAHSRAREVLLDALEGYQVRELLLCPTDLGVPNKRPRYYLVASRTSELPTHDDAAPRPPLVDDRRDWRDYLDDDVDDSFRLPPRVIDKYGKGFHVVDEDATYTTCFTGSYGKSWNFTGSYLRLPDGGLRLFTPREVLRFLHFPESFQMPAELTTRQRWKYAGNSLSAVCVRHALDVLL